MDKNRKFEDIDNSIDEKLKEAYGYSDEQLLAEFEAAERQLQESPELLDELKPPDGEFEKIVARIDEIRGEEKAVKHNKIFKISKALRPMVAVALVGVLVMASAVGVAAKKSYDFKKRENGGANKVIWNNDDNLVKVSKVQDANQVIEKELGIRMITLNYVPEGMSFHSYRVGEDRAVISYLYDDRKVNLSVEIRSSENSSGVYTDTNPYIQVYNYELNMDIPIRKNVLEDDLLEFTAEFSIDNMNYKLTGSIPEDKFIEMVEQLG